DNFLCHPRFLSDPRRLRRERPRLFRPERAEKLLSSLQHRHLKRDLRIAFVFERGQKRPIPSGAILVALPGEGFERSVRIANPLISPNELRDDDGNRDVIKESLNSSVSTAFVSYSEPKRSFICAVVSALSGCSVDILGSCYPHPCGGR